MNQAIQFVRQRVTWRKFLIAAVVVLIAADYADTRDRAASALYEAERAVRMADDADSEAQSARREIADLESKIDRLQTELWLLRRR